MKIDNKKLTLLIAVVALIAISLGSAYYIKRKNKPVYTPPVDPTASWEVYTSPECAFDVKYPKEFAVAKVKMSPIPNTTSCLFLTSADFKEPPTFFLKVLRTPKGSSVNGVMVNTSDEYVRGFGLKPDATTDGSAAVVDKSIGRRKGKYFVSTENEIKVATYLISKNDFFYRFTWPVLAEGDPNLKNLELLLDSIKFNVAVPAEVTP